MKKLSQAFRDKLQKNFFQSHYIETQFGRLHYYDSDPSGQLKPLFLIHGLGSNAQSFFLLAMFFAGQRRLIIPDLFQFSGLSKTNDGKPLSIAQHAVSIEALCTALGLETVDLCGLSMGGWIGLWLAINHHKLIGSLTLINPGGLRLRSAQVREQILTVDKKNFEKMYADIIHNRWLRQTPFLNDLMKKVLYQGLSHKNVRDFIETVDADSFIDEKISEVSCPTLLLWGYEDSFLPREFPYLLVKNVPNIRGYFIFNTGHVPSIESPMSVYMLMREFLGIDEWLAHPLVRKFGGRLFIAKKVRQIVVGGMSEMDLRQ